MKDSEIIDKYRDGMGVTKISKESGLTRGKIYGILRKYKVSTKYNQPLHDLTGNTYGFLTVIRMERTKKSKRGRWRAICQCSNCGNSYYDADPSAIIRGLTTSCGCRRDQYKKNTGKNNKQFTGYEEIRGTTWKKILRCARKRDIPLNIDIEEVWELYLKQNRKCALSDIPIVFGRSANSLKETTASLDRIDNSKGYTSDNIQWVHKDINIMKNTFSQEYFVNLCRLISKNCKGVPASKNFQTLLDMKTGFFGHERNIIY